MYKNPKQFFVRFLLLTLLTLVNIVLLILLSSGGTVGLVVALVLTIINAFLLLFMLVISIMNVIRGIGSKDRSHLGFHILNFLFTIVVNAIFGLFYFAIIAGAMIVLLPFL